MIEDLWYKNAVIYCLDVETFQDGNGDGIGDFRGLKRRVDYLAGLGVTCVWLLPFYPSPNRDNGYDVTDFYGVDRRLGDLGDFVSFTHYARSHGIRVIVDLVVNHTSNQHPWFQAARADPNSPYRDYYVWSEKKPKGAHKGMVFPGPQTTTWTWDDKAGAYYFHRFFDFQPDLNISNPKVLEELFKVMGFWLQLGVSGFRVDAVPFLLEHKGIPAPKGDPYELLRQMRQFLSWRRGDAVLLAEANVPMDAVKQFFGDADRMQMVFNFQANQHFYSGLVRGDARPLAGALRASPKLKPTEQWANFLRNHDELDLGRLEAPIRKEVFEALGPDKKMQLYDRGLRRRLAPMLGSDLRKLRFAYSLMFSLPGTPVLWYGEEIGMGELLSLKERQAVRTPMQWSDDHQGGFTEAEKPFRPLVEEGPFSFTRVNVVHQRNDRGSLLNEVERMIRIRKESPELGWGRWRVLRTGHKAVLALRFDWHEGSLVTVHNFSSDPVSVRITAFEDPKDVEALLDLFGDDGCLPEEDGRYRLTLDGYGYRWFRVGTHSRAAHPSDETER